VYTVGEKVCDIKNYVKLYTALLQFIFPNITFPSTFQFLTIMVQDLRCSQWWEFIIWFELGLHIVWYIHGYECSGGAFWVCLHRPSDDDSSRSRPNHLCWPFRLHGPI